MDLQAVKTSVHMWTGSIEDDTMDTKKDFHDATANMRRGLHKELGLMLQVETDSEG
jgi:hypothetical protein